MRPPPFDWLALCHCCQIAESPAKKLKCSGRNLGRNLTERRLDGGKIFQKRIYIGPMATTVEEASVNPKEGGFSAVIKSLSISIENTWFFLLQAYSVESKQEWPFFLSK